MGDTFSISSAGIPELDAYSLMAAHMADRDLLKNRRFGVVMR
jgi:hypothetical protein